MLFNSLRAEAFSRTTMQHAAAKELYSLVKDLDNYFGHSEGQILYRGVGSELGTGNTRVGRVGGTRKAGALSQLPMKFIKNFKQISVSLKARAEWRKSKHGRITLEGIAETSRRMHDVSFIMFLLTLHCVMLPVRTHILEVQRNIEPWNCTGADETLMASLGACGSAIEEIQKLACICCLMAQHLSVKERGCFFALLWQFCLSLVSCWLAYFIVDDFGRSIFFVVCQQEASW